MTHSRSDSPPQSRLLDLRQAEQITDAFYHSCGAPCQLLDEEGNTLVGKVPAPCAQCRGLFPGFGPCRLLHQRSARQSERFGGRYIYFCPLGMGFISAAVMLNGASAGSLLCGPFLIMEPEDHLAASGEAPAESQLALEALLGQFPRRQPQELSHLSMLLLAGALFVGDSSLAILEEHHFARQSRSIQQYQQEYAPADGGSYPLEQEEALKNAVRDGDAEEARELLNRLLGYLFFATGGDYTALRVRSLELMSVLSRAAISGGADPEQVLTMNQLFTRDSDHLRSTDDLVVWLTRITTRYAALVVEGAPVKRREVMFPAIHYMKQNLSGTVTLEEAARRAGLSPTYFSKVFKDEMGCPFNQYLSRLRIERAKTLLRNTDASVSAVSGMVGYEGESYFIKTFARFTGVTPGQYRKRGGRPDSTRERDNGPQKIQGGTQQ